MSCQAVRGVSLSASVYSILTMGGGKGLVPDDVNELRRALGNRPPPKHISQRPFDHDDAHLHALARLKPSAKPHGRDLVGYALDLQYEEVVQKDLLDYVLPFCLRAWRDDLMARDAEYGGFAEYFYPALVRLANGVLTAADM